ncbi:leucyl aminopeptidase [Luedemannella flava]|uniref:Probable cytosol aminopeptidase n=1 Tax=Luedemannella flava TaxID=349316 RepID=A0ABN2M6H1_9ACTN
MAATSLPSLTTTLSLVDTDPAELAVDAIVVGLHSASGDGDLSGPLLAPGAESVAAAFDGKLAATLALLGASGGAGEVTKLATLGTISSPVIAAVGLGPVPDESGVPAETLRRAVATAVRSLSGNAKVALALPVPDGADGDDLTLRAVAEGALLGGYRFVGYKTKPQSSRRDPVKSVALLVPDAGDKHAKAEIKRATVVTAAVARTRDWVNTAPNELRPPDFAAAVSAAATTAGLEVEVLDEKALKKGGFGGVLAVGMGSAAPPRMVILRYAPKGATTHVALVGKGITFDTGGYAIKPAQGMWEMKSDMAGAAAVASTMIAIAALKPKIAVTAYLPMAENMISGTAYRPGDVVTMYGGKRVEVLNPDAEGRMILADAIVRAAEDDPDYLVETSTLTGGQVISLGKKISGVMGDETFIARVAAAGDRVGEPAWPMPLPDDVRKGMDSDVADISQINAGMDRAGHMLQGGVFLREFVADGLPWAHIDIAGPSYHSGEATGYWTKGGTAVPVRLLLALLDDIAANG